MDVCSTLPDHIQTPQLIDTHEHMPLGTARPQGTDVLEERLMHQFSCDLVSAGLAEARNSKNELKVRWKLAEPCWRAAESRGYGRAVAADGMETFCLSKID